jgi:hypothetical protein
VKNASSDRSEISINGRTGFSKNSLHAVFIVMVCVSEGRYIYCLAWERNRIPSYSAGFGTI